MRAAQIYLTVALVSSAAPALAAPVPRVEARGVELSERAALSGLLKPFLKSAGSSVALGGLLAGISSIFGGGDKAAPARRAEDLTDEDLDDMIAALEASGDFTQEELDQAEAALSEMFPEDGTGKRALSGTVTKEISDFFADLLGAVAGKSALNTALGKNVDGSEKTKRDELIARAGAGGLLAPFLKSAGSSVALGGILAGISKIFGGGDQAAPAKRDELIARAGAGGLLAPFLKSAGSSVALGGILAGLSKVFGGGDQPAAKRAVEDLESMFAQIENSSDLTQEQLDEVEAELEKSFGAGAVEARDLNTRALRLGGLTKGLVGIIGSIAGSLGIGAVLGDGSAKRATEVSSADDIIAMIESSDAFTQEQLDGFEAEFSKTFGSDSIEARDINSRALRLGGLTKGLVGIIGSIAGSIGIDAVLGSNQRRGYEGLNALD